MKKGALTTCFLLFSSILFSQSFDFTADTLEGCSPLKVIFLNTTEESIKTNYTYEWTVESGKYSTQIDSVQNTYLNPGKYTITMKAYDKTKKLVSTISKPNFITIFPDPDVRIKSDKLVNCENKDFLFAIDTVISDTTIVSYTWILSDGTSYLTKVPPPHTFGFKGKFDIFLSITDAHGCSNRERKTITVTTFDDYPNIAFTASKSRVCEPSLTVNFQNVSTAENATEYTWDFGDGSGTFKGKNPPQHTYTGFGTYFPLLSTTSTSGCESSTSRRIQLIDYKPEILITDKFPEVDFDTLNYDKYISADPLITCPCKHKNNDVYKIITNENKACTGTITFTDNTPTKDNITWEWDFNADGTIESTDAEYSVDITKGGTYTIKLTSSNGVCSKETIRTFSVEEPLTISIEPTEGFYCSVPTTIKYTATSNIPGTNFLWKAESLDKFFLSSSYEVTYRSEGEFSNKIYAVSPNNCLYHEVIKNDIEITLPKVNYITPEPRSGCKPLEATFNHPYEYNTDQDSIKAMTMFFGDTENSSSSISFDNKSKSGEKTMDFTYNNDGAYYPKVVIETHKGCSDTAKYTIESAVAVGSIPNISIDYDKDEMCASDKLHALVTINDDPQRYGSVFDTLFIYHRSEHDSVTSKFARPIEPSIAIELADTIGIHTSSYYVSDNGCSVAIADNHEVNVKGPIVSITASKVNCDSPTKFSFWTKKLYDATSWEWSIQNKTKGTPEVIVASNIDTINIDFDDYEGRGTYLIKINAHNPTNGCDMMDSLLVHVAKIQADFGLVYDTYCLNSQVQFDLNCNMGQDIARWTWLYDWNGVKNTATFANCSNGILSRLDQPHTERFKDDCDNYFDSIVQPSKSMLYIVDAENITSVSVIASDINGCEDTLTKPIKIAMPKAQFTGDIISDCLPFTTTFTDTCKNGSIIAKRDWRVNNTTISNANEKSINIPFESEGYKTITLIVTDEYGCTDQAEKINYVKPIVPNSNIRPLYPNVCLGFDAEFVRDTLSYPQLANTLSHYKWDFGDGVTDENTGNPRDTTTHLYAKPTLTAKKYDVEFIAYAISPEGNECVDTSVISVDIKAANARIVLKGADKCKEPGQKFIIYLDNTIYTSSITSFDWWKTDNQDSIYITNRRNLQVVTFDNFGDQELFLQTKSKFHGCENMKASVPVHVPGYEASIMAEKNEACIREDIMFTLFDTLNLHRYNAYWEFGDGNHANMDDLTAVHNYTALAATDDNTYKIQFIVDAEGCKPRDISTHVTIFPVIADFSRGLTDTDTIGCAPYSITLHNKSVAGKDASYLWYLPDGTTSTEENAEITLTEVDSTYPISLSVMSNICNDSTRKNVTTFPIATITVELDSVICYGEAIHAKATGDFTRLQWTPTELFSSPKSSTTDIAIKKSQYIYVTTTNEHNCNDTDSVYIYVQQKPHYLGAPDSLLLYYGDDGRMHNVAKITNEVVAGEIYNLNATKTQGTTYSWSPSTYLSCTDCYNPDLDLSCGEISYEDCLLFPEFIEYTITMSDSLGCFTNDTTIHFNIIMDSKLAMPEAFTPNGDGKNDLALVRGWGIKEFINVTIYNRWGQIVFETNDINQGWDGTFQGKPQGIDTFTYKIKAINIKGEDIQAKGHITLIR